MKPRKSRKPTTRVIVSIRQREDLHVWYGRAIVLASVPPTKKEPTRRKLFLRIHRCEGLTSEGFDCNIENLAYWERVVIGRCKTAPGGIYVDSYPSMSIPIDESTIDSMLDGLIGAQAFLKGQVEKIT